jgi:hypothetical protein
MSCGAMRSTLMRRSRFPPFLRWSKVTTTPFIKRLGARRRRALESVWADHGRSYLGVPSSKGVSTDRSCVAVPSQTP